MSEPYWDPEYIHLLAGALEVLDKNRVEVDPEKLKAVEAATNSERLED